MIGAVAACCICITIFAVVVAWPNLDDLHSMLRLTDVGDEEADAPQPAPAEPLLFCEWCECGRWCGEFDDIVMTPRGTPVYFLGSALVHRCSVREVA